MKAYSPFACMGGGQYATDVRRVHFELTAMCPRCGERYTACRITDEMEGG